MTRCTNDSGVIFATYIDVSSQLIFSEIVPS